MKFSKTLINKVMVLLIILTLLKLVDILNIGWIALICIVFFTKALEDLLE